MWRARHMAGRRTAWEAYDALIAEHLEPTMTVLDVGCGKGLAGPFPWDQYPEVTLVGLDPDPAAASNPHLDRFILLPAEGNWPLADVTVDLAVSRSVLEHVADPDQFLTNLRRVLRPGGKFIFLTPNRRHFSMVISRLLPHRIKTWFLGWTGRRKDDDIFPTHYRMNTAEKLRMLASGHKMQITALQTEDFEPINYLDFCLAGYLLSYGLWSLQRITRLQRWSGASITGVFVRGDDGGSSSVSSGLRRHEDGMLHSG